MSKRILPNMKPIKDCPGYKLSDDGKTIIGKYGRPLKPNGKNCVVLQVGKIRRTVPVVKLIWCANRGVSPNEVPKNYCFRETENGDVRVETFAERMKVVAFNRIDNNKITYEEVLYMDRYIQILKDIIAGEPEARKSLFMLINADRNFFLRYAIHVSGKSEQTKAEAFTDKAIIDTLDAICEHNLMVCNPRGYVKTTIRRYIHQSNNIVKDALANS